MNVPKRKPDLKAISECILFLGVFSVYALLSLQNAGPSLMFITKPVALVTVLFAIFVLFRFRLFPAKVYPELWLLGLYTVLACVPGFFCAVDPAMHKDIAVRLAEGFLLVTAVYALTGLTGSPKAVFWALFLTGFVFTVISLCGGLDYWRRYRQTIGNLNPNHFARVALFAVFAGIGLMNEYKGWRRLAFIPVTLFCVYMVITSGSRVALAALLIGCTLYIILSWQRADLKKFYRFFLPGCGILLLAAVGFFLIRQPYQLYSIWKRFLLLFNGDTASTRFSGIVLAFRHFLSRPIFGIGAYQFGAISEGTLAKALTHCHFDTVELLMSFGLCGFAAYAGAGFYGGRGLKRIICLNGCESPKLGSLPIALAALFAAYIVLGIGDATIYEVNCQMVWGFLTCSGMLNRMNGPAV